MDLDPSRWDEINRSEHPHERDGLRELASYLPDADPYHVWANVEFVGTDGSINEIDALVLTPSGLHVIELKHWQGEISGNGQQWVRRLPRGRVVLEDNPYILANRKAKRLAGLIKYYARRQNRADRCPYVGAAVFLHARDCRVRLDRIGRAHIYGLDPSSGDATGTATGHGGTEGLESLKSFLTALPANPDHRIDSARGREIIDLVRAANLRPSVAQRRIGQLILQARPFAEGDGWQEYLATHRLDAQTVRRVRFYLTRRAAEDDIPAIRRAAEREFRLLQGVHHPGIAHPVDLVDHQFGPAVVFDHASDAIRFDQWLAAREQAKQRRLTLAQKLQIVQELAEIIDYAHSRHLLHRALHPRAIFVTRPDSPRRTFVVADWQAGGRTAGASRLSQLSSAGDGGASLELFFDDHARRYQAPEGIFGAAAAGMQLDVFSLGAITYRIFAGRDPASSAEELVSAVRSRGLDLAAVVDGVPDGLVRLVFNATHGDPKQRLATVAEFRRRLNQVWEEVTAPEPEPVTDPISAKANDVLEGGLRVIERLGSGATAVALLVRDEAKARGEEVPDRVLKIARAEQYADRLADEAATLNQLKGNPLVASIVAGPLTIGPRTALLMESAGPRTLARELHKGRLALDLLERYGTDLLEIVSFLDSKGIWHRDLKPANLGIRPRPSDRQPHLCVFDFSLAATPATNLSAGTVGYLDPFLGPPSRTRYDAAAERFAAAVTLYEMATGELPRWGENANPAAIDDEVSLDPSLFDQSIADRMVAFFAKALARDARARFDTIAEMAAAWRQIFVAIPTPAPVTGPAGLTSASGLEATTLSVRARSVLERLGVHTVGELIHYEPAKLSRAQGVTDAARREILAQIRSLRSRLAPPGSTGRAGPVAADDVPSPQGIEALCDDVFTFRDKREAAAMRVFFGLDATPPGQYLRWPTQKAAADATGQTQPQLSNWLRRCTRQWSSNKNLEQVRDEIVALLQTRGGVMSAEELAEALIAARGSFTEDPHRIPQAIGLVRAAVEVELARLADSRVAIRRPLRATDTVLIGLEPDDTSAETDAADRLEYAVLLGQRASSLATMDPLASRQQAIDELRAVRGRGRVALDDSRLLQLAVAASPGDAALSPQGQIYPVGMPAARALRLSANALVGRSFTVEALQDRVASRFPKAERLPGRPRLNELLEQCEIPLHWDAGQQVYVPKTWQSLVTSTRVASSAGPLAGPDEISEVDNKLSRAISDRGYLAVMAPLRHLVQARRNLLARHRLVEVNITSILLRRLRELGHPWPVIVEADTGRTGDQNFEVLCQLVQHEVMPAVADALAAASPILITEAAPLARYGQMRLLQELADATVPRPAARLLLVPARRPDPVLLDHEPVPLTSRSAQSLWLPEAWIDQPARVQA